jgi:hypothetical protein
LKREQVWQQAAFFTQAKLRKPYLIDQEFSLLEKGRGFYDTKRSSVLRVPRYEADVAPKFLLTGETPRPGERWREAYARMVTSHPQFARATVNLIWAEIMGAGLVDPPFGFDSTNPDQALHAELLDELARDFAAHGYNLRRVIRTIVTSSAYQLSSYMEQPWKPEYGRYFARHMVRRLPAETVADAILQATDTAEPIPVWRSDQTVRYVMQTRSYEDLRSKETAALKEFLIVLGQSNRDKSERDLTPTSAVTAELMNGRFVRERVQIRKGGRLDRLWNREPRMPLEQIASEMFLAFLSRPPEPAERAIAVRTLEKGAEGLEDLAWTLINRTEFLYNR